MRHLTFMLLSCIFGFTASLNAQQAEVNTPVAIPEIKDQENQAQQLNSPSDIVENAGEVTDSNQVEKNAQAVQATPTEDTAYAQETEMTDEGTIKTTDTESEATEGEGSAEVGNIEAVEEEEEDFGPVVVSVNEKGELVGRSSVNVSGEVVPVEANITIVQDGVRLTSLYSNEDGSFSFPNIAPGQYDMYGSASGYCGQRAVTVVPGNACCDTVGLRLDQSAGNCYSGLSNAPAASFSSGGLGGAPVFSGPATLGGFGGGGGGFISGAAGGAAGRTGLRLLGIGGIATAIALGGNDDASPSE